MKIKRLTFSSWVNVVWVGLALSAAVFAGGCKGKGTNFIERVDVEPSADLKQIRVALVFSPSIRSDLAGNFVLGSAGFLFVNPYLPSQRFEMGLSLETSVFTDPEYVKAEMTQTLPNGLPIGVDYPLAQIQAASPISSKFDLFAYVDVTRQEWLGAAAIFSFINDSYFPNGVSVSSTFLKDDEGKPGILAAVFGPTLDGFGNMSRAGGIALFANVPQLIANGALGPNARRVSYRSRVLPTVSGPNAGKYRGNVNQLMRLESNLVRAFNAQPPLSLE